MWRGFKCVLMFRLSSNLQNPKFLGNLLNSPNLSWHLDMALKVGKASSPYSQHTTLYCFQPCKEGKGCHEKQAEKMEHLAEALLPA